MFPLVADRGTAVTSRELSEAAGVAEGTIFKVFADKDDLFRAVLDRVADPEPTEQGIRSIDPALPYEQRLEVAAELVQRRLVDIWNILSKIGSVGMSIERRTMPVSEATVELFAAEPDRIRITPDDAARRFRALIVAFSQPALYEPSPSAAELVRLPPPRCRSCVVRLGRLLRDNLGPHRGLIAALVLLQALQTTANLSLPAISARLIDDGVLVGNRDTIWRLGGLMVVVSIVQVGFAAAAMWFAAQLAMGFGRDVRRNLFRRVVSSPAARCRSSALRRSRHGSPTTSNRSSSSS